MSGQLSLIDLEDGGRAAPGPVGNTARLGQPQGRDGSRRLKSEIAGLLADGVWRTSAEISLRVRVRKQTVTDALKASPHLFRCEPGGWHGRKHNAVLWQLADDTDAAENVNQLEGRKPRSTRQGGR